MGGEQTRRFHQHCQEAESSEEVRGAGGREGGEGGQEGILCIEDPRTGVKTGFPSRKM